MNHPTSRVAEVDIGTPPSGLEKWESAKVYVHGFADLPTTGNDEEVDSPEFTCLGHQWSLSVFPGGHEDYSDDGMVALDLFYKSNERISVDYSISVKNWASNEVARREASNIFFYEKNSNSGDENFAKRSTLLKALTEGTLTIEVQMKKSRPTTCSSVAFIPKNPLGDNILKKFMDEESSDVAFEAKMKKGRDRGKNGLKRAKTFSTTFHAHRLILQDGAPMLAELCKPERGDSSTVSITDVDPDIFRHMLYYIYGGDISDDDLEENAKELIDAADKFGVVSLKLEAEACYVRSTAFTIDNVNDNLLYADSKNCALLKEAVMDFMVENGGDIIGKVSFDNVHVPGSVITDLLTAMAREKKRGDDANGDGSDYTNMRVGTLRRMLHEKGLDVDGSREAMIVLLKENSQASPVI